MQPSPARVFALLLLAAASCFGQEITGSILGSILDPSGRAVPGATVTITNTDRGAVMRTTKTDAQGNYAAPLLPIGHYALGVEAAGFKKALQERIELNVNDKLTVTVTLEVGDVQQEITVESSQVQVELQSPTAQSLISGQQVRELALNSRN